MSTKTSLVKTICGEFRRAQSGEAPPWVPEPKRISFPPLLPVGTGKHLPATDVLLSAVRDYAKLIRENSSEIRSAFTIKQFEHVVALAFGRGLNWLNTASADPDELRDLVDGLINGDVDAQKQDTQLLTGCWLVEDDTAYPIVIGPVRFEQRLNWLDAQAASGMLSLVAARRIRRCWAGEKLRKRESSWEEHKETAVLESIGQCPIVCSVRTHGLSSEVTVEKGLLAARVAITALSLLWNNPRGALQQMNLVYDAVPRRREYAVIYASGGFGSGSSWVTLPSGQHTSEPFQSFIDEFRPTLEIVGEVLAGYVNPHHSLSRPKVANALFLALWWFHEGCRQTSDQMAVTAFAATLDALSAGGKAAGIKRVIEARLGYKPADKLMRDGRTVNTVIDRVYDAARSRFIHGSSADFVEDWSEIRATAQAVARLLLLQLTYWLEKNPAVTDLKAVQTK